MCPRPLAAGHGWRGLQWETVAKVIARVDGQAGESRSSNISEVAATARKVAKSVSSSNLVDGRCHPLDI